MKLRRGHPAKDLTSRVSAIDLDHVAGDRVEEEGVQNVRPAMVAARWSPAGIPG